MQADVPELHKPQQAIACADNERKVV